MNGTDDPRTPSDLADRLRDADLLETFEAMAPSQRREYIEWIVGAKRDTTRQSRIADTLTRLSQHERA